MYDGRLFQIDVLPYTTTSTEIIKANEDLSRLIFSLCCLMQPFATSNLLTLYGIHQRFLNNLVGRYDEQLIDDFYRSVAQFTILLGSLFIGCKQCVSCQQHCLRPCSVKSSSLLWQTLLGILSILFCHVMYLSDC